MILDVSEKKSVLAAKLKALREARGLSQKTLGTLAGVSWRTIQNIESGVSERGASDLLSLAERLDVSLDELITGEKPGGVLTAEELVSALGELFLKDDFRADLAVLVRAHKSGSRGN